MENEIKLILSDIAGYENNNLSKNIKDRLDKSLNIYLSDINNSYNYVVDNIKDKHIMKELTK